MSTPLQIGEHIKCDFLVIGGGIAGSSLALKLAAMGTVILATKESLYESNTRYAQGGIASVFGQNDTYDAHVADTLIAGAGLCHENVVRKVVENGPKVISELIEMGVPFTPDPNSKDPDFSFHLTREGGHSARRIIHADDLTGHAVQITLCQKIRSHPQITVLEDHTCIDLIVTDKAQPDFSRNRCLGAYLLSEKKAEIRAVVAAGTFLATGGHGKIYLFSTNPAIATGDGIALARRAGARIANLEFMQFHPTCLYSSKMKSFLISESLRGEGAVLRNKRGDRFMEKAHPLKELAPRDIVARAIDSELKRSGESHVYLDISHKSDEFIKAHFPNIFSACMDSGIDITEQSIPVVPAAHYSCGGVVTDLRGRTGIKSLWALGEVACTGLHGANRLASNSLLEGLVFASFIAKDVELIHQDMKALSQQTPSPPKWRLGKACEPDEMVVINHLWDEIRRTMWNYVGIVRSDKRLERADARINQILEEIETFYWDVLPSRALIEVRNLATTAQLTIKCARSRKESRGIHFSLSYPQKDDAHFLKDTVLS